MFTWLAKLLGFKTYRTAQPWETPPEVRKRLRCAIAGIDPDSVKEPVKEKAKAPPLAEGVPPANP
jgi:hypothetical protein